MKPDIFLQLSILSLAIIGGCYSYRILGVFPIFAKSHSILGHALMKGLAEAGHNVTYVTPLPTGKTISNYREVSIWTEVMANHGYAEISLAQDMGGVFSMFAQIPEFAHLVSNVTLNHPNMQDIIHNTSGQFDLVICEIFLNEAMVGLSHALQAPLVGVASYGSSKQTNDLVGSPAPYSFVPATFLTFTDRMSFFERVANSAYYIYEKLNFDFRQMPLQEQVYNQAFPDPKPKLETLRRNVSLVLLNSHFSVNSPRPYVPNMIEVGGFHVNRKTNPLPKEIKDFIDNAPDGVIYFSMGSMIKATTFPDDKREVLLKVFSRLKQRVIWKWEDPNLPGKPDNVFISKWLPQDDILAHPNIRFFITHGGLLGLTEAIYHGVPIIGMPVFGDQELNLARAVKTGYGLKVSVKDLNEESLSSAIHDMLSNDSYKKMAQKISSLYRDQPMTPLDTAIYWIEYIARHQGAPHLRSAGQDLNFYQYHSLDVFGFLFAIFAFALVICKTVFRILLSKVVKKFPAKKVKTN